MTNSVFHPGERLAQSHAGIVRDTAPIRPFLPPQHRDFFESLALLPIATVPPGGAPIATFLTGPRGFISSPDANTLHISALPAPDDPASTALIPGAQAAVIGIELATRRRNRANGVVAAHDATGLTLSIRESFGNCPQYIQARGIAPAAHTPAPTEHLATLDAHARALIAAADTAFVATASAHGADISHRGGRPGFLHLEADRLSIPDFPGNGYFNTFGNLLLDPRASLLIPDFTTGDVLHLTGTASIDWSPSTAPTGTARLWHLDSHSSWRRRTALPLRFSNPLPAPTTLATGNWPG